MDEEIKNNWRNTRFTSDENSACLRDIMEGRRRSSLENLARRYRRFSTFSLVWALFSTSFFRNPLFGDGVFIITWSLIALFLTFSVIDFWFYRGIRSIDIATMPIAEVAAKALYYRKRHLQSVAVLMPCAFSVVGLIVYFSAGDKPYLYGIIAGAVIGLTIGIRKLLQFMSDYRSLSE